MWLIVIVATVEGYGQSAAEPQSQEPVGKRGHEMTDSRRKQEKKRRKKTSEQERD